MVIAVLKGQATGLKIGSDSVWALLTGRETGCSVFTYTTVTI